MPASRVDSKHPWHVVLVLDDSGSMSGAPASDVNKAVAEMVTEMSALSGGGKKPYFRLSIVKFGSRPHRLAVCAGEGDIDLSQVTTLDGNSGSTNAAAALDEVQTILSTNPGQPTDFTPYVFFLSDGAPDDAPAALAAGNGVKALQISAGAPIIVTIGFGSVNDAFMSSLA